MNFWRGLAGSRRLAAALLAGSLACSNPPAKEGETGAEIRADSPYLVVLGNAQDGGSPQAGTKDSGGWDDPGQRRHVVCMALVDPRLGLRWLFEATPDFKDQLQRLDQLAPVEGKPGLGGIFLTHAHIGHYLGLAQLGHEVIGARLVPVYAMPRMADFLRSNGPWDQLVRYENIELKELSDGQSVNLGDSLLVTPFLVPHRQEYSEVVGYRIQGPRRSALFIPDIDSWEEWDSWGTRIEDQIALVDIAFLDGSFFANGEVGGRDMSGFPHPMITHSMNRFGALPAVEKAKVRFIHLNHTNPAMQSNSPERRLIEKAGFAVADPLDRFGL